MKDEYLEESSQDSLEKVIENKITLIRSKTLSELYSPDMKSMIHEGHNNIKNLQDVAKLERLVLGCYFVTCKEKEPHGNFQNRMKEEFPLYSSRTIRRYMVAYTNRYKTIHKIQKDPESKRVIEKSKKGEKLTRSEEIRFKIVNSTYYINKTLLLIDIHGVEETLENYIPEDKKDSLVKDIVYLTTDEVSNLDKEESKLTQEKIKLKLEYDAKKKIVNKKLKLIQKEKLYKTQLLLELKPKI